MFYVIFVGVVGSVKNSNVLYAKQKQDRKHLKELFLYNKYQYDFFKYTNIKYLIKLNVYIYNYI